LDVTPVQESLGRCTVRGGFMACFLERLAASHRDLARAARAADGERQRQVLRRALQMMILYAKGSPMAVTALDRIAHSPEANGMALRPELYPCWLESLMETVAQFDPAFSPALDKRWREVLGAGLAYLAAPRRHP